MLYPMFCLVMLTFVFIYLQLFLRVNSVLKRKVSVKYFRLLDDNRDVPRPIIAGQKHFANLFETPVLFYIVSVLSIALQYESILMVTLAWVFVFSRVVHAVIHNTYNNVLHRMIVFQVSLLCIFLLWILLLIGVSKTH